MGKSSGIMNMSYRIKKWYCSHVTWYHILQLKCIFTSFVLTLIYKYENRNNLTMFSFKYMK